MSESGHKARITAFVADVRSGNGRTGRAATVLMALAGAVIFVWSVLKAQQCSFTHDESLTWSEFVHLPLGDLLAHKETYTNNHMLNSIGMKFSEAAFGNGELALRLPNLLALVCYLVYGALIMRSFGPVIGTLGYVCLCFSPGVIELFTLARGYGLSFGFILMAQYHGARSLLSQRRRHAVLAHVALIMAILSSFVTVQYAVALLAALPLVAWLLPRVQGAAPGSVWRALRIHALLLPLTVFAVWEPLRRVTTENEFEFGGSDFMQATISSLVYAAFPTVEITDQDVRVAWYTFLGAAAFIAIRYLAIRFRDLTPAPLPRQGEADAMLAWSTVSGSLMVIVLQHVFVGTPYPEARFCKYLLPLIFLCMGALAWVVSRYRFFWPIAVVMASAAYGSVTSFFGYAGFRSSIEWQYDMDTDVIMDAVQEDIKDQGFAPRTATIGLPWVLEPTANYYRLSRGMVALRPAHRNGPAWTEDYLVLNDTMMNGLDSSCYRRMGHYPNAGLWLYRRSQ